MVGSSSKLPTDDFETLEKIQVAFTWEGNPQQNAYIERYNRTVRYEWLNQYSFSSIAEVH